MFNGKDTIRLIAILCFMAGIVVSLVEVQRDGISTLISGSFGSLVVAIAVVLWILVSSRD